MCLDSNISPIRLPVKSLTSIFKASKVSGLLQLRDSKDSSVRLSCPPWKLAPVGMSGRQLALLNAVSVSKRFWATLKQIKQA